MELVNKAHEVEDIVAEEIKNAPAPVDTISLEVAKFDTTFGSQKARLAIAALKAQYSPLTITGPEDKKGYEEVRLAIKDLREKRVAVGKKHQELKADSLKLGRALDTEKNELTGLLEAIEEPLQEAKDNIDLAVKRAKDEADRLEQERLQGRVAELLASGMSFTGSFYVLAGIRLDVITLKVMKDEEYQGLLTEIKAEHEKVLEAQRKKEEDEAAEKKALEHQRLEQEKTAKEQQEAKEKMKKDFEELERAKAEISKQRYEMRANQLEALGLTYGISEYEPDGWVYVRAVGDKLSETVFVENDEVNTSEKWGELLEKLKTDKKALDTVGDEWDEKKKVMDAEAERLEEVRKLRLSRFNSLKELAYTYTGEEDLGEMSTAAFNELYTMRHGIHEAIKEEALRVKIKAEQEEADLKAKEEEEDRLAGLSVTDRVKEYVNKIRSIPLPIVEVKRSSKKILWIKTNISILDKTLTDLETSLK